MTRLIRFLTALFCLPVFLSASPREQWESIYTQEVYDYYDSKFPGPDDYANKVYIDPDYAGGGSDGTIEKPYTSLLHVAFTTDTAYLIKRGTTHSIAGEGSWRISKEDILIGAYGEGDRPVLSGNRTITLMEDRNVVRDIHMSTIRFGGFGIPERETAVDSVLFNCVLDGTSENVALGRNMTIIGCEVYGNRVNAIFLQQLDWETYSNLEVGYNYIHTINQLWFGDGTPEGRIGQTPAGGDPIHIASRFHGHFWIHNNVLDRSDTGNKFNFIANVVPNYAAPGTGVFENNICYGPMSDPSTGNIVYIDGGTPEIPFESIIIRNNVMIGTYDEYSDTWTAAAVYVVNAKVEIYGNVIKNVSTVLLRSANHGGDSFVYNNTVVNVKGNSVLGGHVKQMHNNIFPHSGYFVTGGTVQGNNVFIDQHGAENIFVDPLAGDYRLREGSPAINAGVWLDYMQYEKDIRGVVVSQDDNIDAGAMQFTEGEATVPPQPAGLNARAGDGEVVLTWNPTSTATGYEVKRFESGGLHEVVATPSANSYTDSDVINGVTYYYIVVAINDVGRSTDSAQVSATPSEDLVPTEWAGFGIHEGQWVDTGTWLGRIDVRWTPWNYVEDNQNWIYLPEDHVEEKGAWMFLPRTGGTE